MLFVSVFFCPNKIKKNTLKEQILFTKKTTKNMKNNLFFEKKHK